MFANDLAYGYNFDRTVIDFTPGKPLGGSANITVAADQGWQNTGLKLEAGKSVDLSYEWHYFWQ